MNAEIVALGCGLAFVVSHHLMSHPGPRDRLIGSLGYGPFLGAYSVVSSVFWLPLTWIWWTRSATTTVLWANHGPLATVLGSALSVGGVVLLLMGAGGGSRTSMGTRMQGKEIKRVVGASGFTRHPVFGGFVLFSLGHLLVDGGVVDLAFHGTNLAVAVIGMYHQDYRYGLTDPTYAEWVRQTRAVPLPWPVAGTTFRPIDGAFAVAGVGAAVAARLFLH